MPARMGHACVVFQEKLWVLGGYDNGLAYRDVWRLNEDQGNLNWEQAADFGRAGSERCNHAAATFMNEQGQNDPDDERESSRAAGHGTSPDPRVR